MTWVIWRQHRIELLITVLLLGAFLAGLVATGQVLAAGAFPGSSDFANLLESFMSAILIPMQFLPLLAGVFIGAPLVAREYESGTFNLAWTQGITRQRWLGMKLAWLGGRILVVFTLLALAGSWWNEPVNALLGPFRDFDAQDRFT